MLRIPLMLAALVPRASGWTIMGCEKVTVDGKPTFVANPYQTQNSSKKIYKFPKNDEWLDRQTSGRYSPLPQSMFVTGPYDRTDKKKSYVCDLEDVKASTSSGLQCACTPAIRDYWDNDDEEGCKSGLGLNNPGLYPLYCGVPSCDQSLVNYYNQSGMRQLTEGIPAEREVQGGAWTLRDCLCKSSAYFLAASTNHAIVRRGNKTDPLYAGAYENMAAFCSNPSCSAIFKHMHSDPKRSSMGHNYCLDPESVDGKEYYTIYYDTPKEGEAPPETFTLTFVVRVDPATFDEEAYKTKLANMLGIPVAQVVIVTKTTNSGRRLAEGLEVTAYVETSEQKAKTMKSNINEMDVGMLSSVLGTKITEVKTISGEKGTMQETKGVSPASAGGSSMIIIIAAAAGAAVVALVVGVVAFMKMCKKSKTTVVGST